MRRDPLDSRRPERTAAGFLASVFIHALLALSLFSLPSSTSEESAPESFSGAMVVSVTQQVPQKTAPVPVPRNAIPVPHARVVPRIRVAAAIPRSAQPHPRILHVLAKFKKKAPPNPTPAPVSSTAPNPLPTRAVIAVTPAPIAPVVPTAAPVKIAAVAIRIPPTVPPRPNPKAVPKPAPVRAPVQPTASPPKVTPRPIPSAPPATRASAVATLASSRPVPTPGAPRVTPVPKPLPTMRAGTAPTPGPRAQSSPGPHRGLAPAKAPSAARPVQVLPTPKPSVPRAPSVAHAAHQSLNQRLASLIPTAAPSFSPAPRKHYSFLNIPRPTPEPEPTPPPDVIAATKFLYTENVASQRWKQSILGTAPEERYVKMYVTAVRRIGFVKWCTGWVVRSPLAGDVKWIVEPRVSYICQGRLDPFTPPPREPSKGS